MRLTKAFASALLIGACVLVSCTKEAVEIEPNNVQAFNPNEEFATILSKAMFENQSLREFIREEALKQYDKDFDVFYPWVKDVTVDGASTFRELLCQYDDKGIMSEIEQSLPKLTILVPDWSWAEAFCAEEWDTSDPDVSVMYDDNGKKSIANNGEKIYTLKDGELPGFSCVIVKQNERMKVSPGTKAGGELSYEFIDDAFDASLCPKTKAVDHEYYDWNISTQDYSNFVSASEMQSRSNVSITAYNVFKNNPYACHRDNIYYGMTDEIQNGKLNNRIREYIAKFRFSTFNSEFLFDGNDFYGCPNSYTRYVGIDSKTLIDEFKYDGDLELYFHIYVGDNSGSVNETIKYVPVSFHDVFQLSKVHVDYKHKTWFSDPKWVFTVDKNCFVPKWFDADVQLPAWDINNQSTQIKIKVYEYDSEEEVTTTESVVISQTDNFSVDGSVDGKVGNDKISASTNIKIGYGINKKNEKTVTITTKTKKGSDNFGDTTLDYTNPVIISSETFKGVQGYRVKEINTKFVNMLILPRYE